MVATPQRIANKAEAAYQGSIPEAIAGYEAALPSMPQAIIDKKEAAKTSYEAALNSPNYDANLRAGLAIGKADVAYSERLGQIEQTGFTDSQKANIAEEVIVRRHVAGLIDSVIALFNQSTGDPVFLAGLSSATQRQIVNKLLMKNRNRLSETTTAPQCITIIKGEISNTAEISAKS